MIYELNTADIMLIIGFGGLVLSYGGLVLTMFLYP
jgi:hypothetical protein